MAVVRPSRAAWRSLGCGLLLGAAIVPGWAQTSPAKKELAARAVQLQAPGIEQMARGLVEQPAVLMLREAAQLIQQRVPAEQREAVGKRIQDSARKYVDESVPLLRDRALKLAPATLGPALEEKFTEEELRQLVAWLESPVSRKYQQAVPEMQNKFVEQLVSDSRPLIDPKLQALEQSIRSALGLPAVPAGNGASAPAARLPAQPASKPPAR
jgi:hypothetical protein